MKTPPFEPTRFLDQPPHNDAGKVGHLIRQAIAAPEKPPLVLKGRIRQTLRRRSASRRRHMRTILVGATIFISGGVVGAVVQPILRLGSQLTVESVEKVGPAPAGRRGRSGRSARTPPMVSPGEAAPAPSEPIHEIPVPTSPAAPAMEKPEGPAVAPAPSSIPPAPTKAETAPARSSRSRVVLEKPERPALPVSAPNLQAEHSIPLAMREVVRPAIPALPTPLQPPAFIATSPAPSLAMESGESAFRRISPAKAAAPVAQPPGEVATPAGPPPSEQALVASAISSLRTQRRPAAALAALDQYEARFPKGSMLAEVARLRAEALLLLGQRRAALDELSRAPTGISSDEESRLVRGELRASAGRWREALQDFDALVAAWLTRDRAAGMSTKLQGRLERALWGRACARSHLGDESGARADLQELRLRFPQGRFAVQAVERLGGPR